MSMKEIIFSMMIEALENIDEAVEVSHDRYMRSHGKKARDTGQSGNWMFTHKSTGDVDYNDEKQVHNARGKFSDAKKSAQQWAKQHGHRTVYVMESVEQIDELAPNTLHSYIKKATGEVASRAISAVAPNQSAETKKHASKLGKRIKGITSASGRLADKANQNEEVELDELNKSTVASYADKSFRQANTLVKQSLSDQPKSVQKASTAAFARRSSGIKAAGRRLGKDVMQKIHTSAIKKEEVEQIDELSKKTLGSYVKKAGGTSLNSAGAHMADYGANSNQKSFKKGINRAKGVMRAADRLTKEEVELDEADAVVTHKWYSVKNWKDGSDHFDNLDNHLGSHSYKHAALGNTAKKRPDHHIGIPVKAKSAIAYMDKHASAVNEEVDLDEAEKPNQYIEVINKFTGAKSHHEVHPSKAFAALNRHNSLWSTKSARIVSGKEAEEIKASKMKKEEVELDEGIKEKIGGIIRRQKEKEYPLLQNRRDVAADKAAKAYAKGDEKKGNRYMAWRTNNMKKEEVELDEETMPGNVALRLVDRHQAAAFHHKKNGNMKGYAAHFKVAERIEDAVIRAGRDMPVKSKQLEAASDKAFKDHPHRVVKN